MPTYPTSTSMLALFSEEQLEKYFVVNKYLKWYCNIIIKAQQRLVNDYYVEKHHILPYSFEENEIVVELTYEEHFDCHWLLTKCTEGQYKSKMHHGLSLMGSRSSNKPIVSSWQYAIARTALAGIPSTLKGRHGPKQSQETIDKRFATMRANGTKPGTKPGTPSKQKGQPSPLKGRKQAYPSPNKGRPSPFKGQKQTNPSPNKGRPSPFKGQKRSPEFGAAVAAGQAKNKKTSKCKPILPKCKPGPKPGTPSKLKGRKQSTEHIAAKAKSRKESGKSSPLKGIKRSKPTRKGHKQTPEHVANNAASHKAKRLERQRLVEEAAALALL